MPTLVLTDVPGPLYDQIHRLAQDRHRSPADTAVEVLETALRTRTPAKSEAPLPQAPYLTEEICAPCTIPWPKGEVVEAVEVPAPLPTAHDFPDED